MGKLKDILNDIGAEAGRLGKLGADEIAAALFRGNPFVQYGPGQRSPGMGREAEQEPEQQPETPQQDQGMGL